MSKHKWVIVVIIALSVLVMVPVLLVLHSSPKESERELSNQGLVDKYMKSKEHDIEFIGKVVNENGRPVSNARVNMILTSYQKNGLYKMGQKYLYAVTDINGIFRISGQKGLKLYIEKIKAEGYVFSAEDNAKRGFEYSGVTQKIFEVDEIKPVEFLVRTEILDHPIDEFYLQPRTFKTDGCAKIDLMNKKMYCFTLNGIDPTPADAHCDMIIKILIDEKGCNTVITVPRSGWMKVLDEKLAVMPKGEYVKKYAFFTDIKSVGEKYIYVYSKNMKVSAIVVLSVNQYLKKDFTTVTLAADNYVNWFGASSLYKNDLNNLKRNKLIEDRKIVIQSMFKPANDEWFMDEKIYSEVKNF